MKRLHLPTLAVTVIGLLVTVLLMAQSTPPRYSRVENVVYFTNPLTGRLGLYLSFELESDHVYLFQWTRDGVTFSDGFRVDTKGIGHDTYESFNIPDPCHALWPRIVDLGPSP
jgi:hypothetical protein